MKHINFRSIIVIILAVMLLVLYFIYAQSIENKDANVQEVQLETESSDVEFVSEGILLSGLPGQNGYAWHLIYEGLDGKSTMSVLKFSSEFNCIDGQQDKNCYNQNFNVNDKVKIEGNFNDQKELEVSSLEIIAKNPPLDAEAVPFHESLGYGTYGSLMLEGYLEINDVTCEVGTLCYSGTYASFVYTNGNTEQFKYVPSSNFNPKNNVIDRIGLGCYQKDKNQIYSTNDSDDKGDTITIIKGVQLKKLLNSSPKNLVKLKMVSPIYLTGHGAPDCYAYFRDFEVVE